MYRANKSKYAVFVGSFVAALRSSQFSQRNYPNNAVKAAGTYTYTSSTLLGLRMDCKSHSSVSSRLSGTLRLLLHLYATRKTPETSTGVSVVPRTSRSPAQNDSPPSKLTSGASMPHCASGLKQAQVAYLLGFHHPPFAGAPS